MRRWQKMGAMSPGASTAKGFFRKRGRLLREGFGEDHEGTRAFWERYATEMLGEPATRQDDKSVAPKQCGCACGQSANDETVMASSQATTEPLGSQGTQDSGVELTDQSSQSGTEESESDESTVISETDEEIEIEEIKKQLPRL